MKTYETIALKDITLGAWFKIGIIFYMVATVISGILNVVTSSIAGFQAMMIYGEGDPELMAGAISTGIVDTALSLIAGFIAMVIIVLVTWILLRIIPMGSLKIRPQKGKQNE